MALRQSGGRKQTLLSALIRVNLPTAVSQARLWLNFLYRLFDDPANAANGRFVDSLTSG